MREGSRSNRLSSAWTDQSLRHVSILKSEMRLQNRVVPIFASEDGDRLMSDVCLHNNGCTPLDAAKAVDRGRKPCYCCLLWDRHQGVEIEELRRRLSEYGADF